jgi:hypothetical protein
MEVTTNQNKMWRICIGLKKAQLPHLRDISVYKTKTEVIGWSFHIEHITNPVTSVKKEAEHEDQATILSQVKLISLVQTEVSDQWVPIRR